MQRIRVLIFLLLTAPWLLEASAAGAVVDEYAVKAAIAYNIARYTEWPKRNEREFTFCVIGDHNAYSGFSLLGKKQLYTLPINVKHIQKLSDVSTCSVLFVSKDSRNLLPRIHAATANQPILTIGEMPGFNESGGVVNLLTRDDKIIFFISRKSAKTANLKVSSKLLRLAELVD